MRNLMDYSMRVKIGLFFRKQSIVLIIDSNDHTFSINNYSDMMLFFKEFGKVDKNVSHKECSANYDGRKLEAPECLKMRILIMKDTHDIMNFINI